MSLKLLNLALQWAPNSALICVFKKYHIYTYKQLFLFSVSSWRRAIILRDDDMYTIHTWSYLLNVRTSTYRFWGSTKRNKSENSSWKPHLPCRQILQRYLTDPNSSTYPLAVPPRSWLAQIGGVNMERSPQFWQMCDICEDMFSVCIIDVLYFVVFEYIVCIRLCYWIFVTSKNYGHIFSYCNGWNWRWTNRSWLTFGHDLIICWITGRFAHLEDFYLDTWQDQKL